MAKVINWIGIEGEYLAGQKSIREIAEEYGISEGGIRKRAKKSGWVRDATGKKREMVKAKLISGTQEGTQYAVRSIEQAAEEDAIDMELGLANARKALNVVKTMLDVVADARDLKTLSECNAKNIEVIRRIRGLDDPQEQAGYKVGGTIVERILSAVT